uniref:Uncharacterized protein n=1 Tax=Anguilla anguilla TaxID=7936 RepID=A0A0E9PMT7_ANGAN
MLSFCSLVHPINKTLIPIFDNTFRKTASFLQNTV